MKHIFLGRKFALEFYKSFQDKKELIDEALRIQDGDAILVVRNVVLRKIEDHDRMIFLGFALPKENFEHDQVFGVDVNSPRGGEAFSKFLRIEKSAPRSRGTPHFGGSARQGGRYSLSVNLTYKHFLIT